MDAGDVWAESRFPMRAATKSSLYRNEVTEAAVVALTQALERIERGESPEPLDCADPMVRGRARPPMRQADRAIDWRTDDTTTVLRKIRAADGAPGVLDDVRGVRVYLFDAHCESILRFGRPRPATSSRSATARSSARRSTARSGSPISSAKVASRERSSCRRRWCCGIGSPACRRFRLRRRRRSTVRHGGRSATRSATASAGCTSPSTTARWGPRSAKRCARRSATRRRARRASSC